MKAVLVADDDEAVVVQIRIPKEQARSQPFVQTERGAGQMVALYVRHLAPAPELGRNGLYDLAPHADLSVPALAEHFATRRARTLEAIKAGLGRTLDLDSPYADSIAEAVLASLEQMWRDDEAFS